MTGIIVTIPPTVELPPGNNPNNPASLPPVTYQYALLNIPQTWTAKQTFPLGNIAVNAGDITGVIPSGILPLPTSSTLGGIKSLASASHQFLTQIGTDGSVLQAQPAVSDITDVAWTAYTPTSAFSTPGTSVMGAASGRWKQVGKVVFFTADCTCTTVGTGTGQWVVGLPTAASASNTTVFASGKEVITLGSLLALQGASTTTINAVKYDNTSLALGGNGTRIIFGGAYEAA